MIVLLMLLMGMSSIFAQTVRLPNALAPTRYILELNTDLDKSTFTGKITIEISCREVTRAIVLNSKELTISQPGVTFHLVENQQPTRQIAIESQSFDEKNDLYTILVGEDLIVNSMYQLFIPYDGKLRDDSQGFFKISYTDDTDQSNKLMAVTLLVPDNARLVIPCLDEPLFKATFKITLIHSSKLVAASNMILLDSKPDSQTNTVIDSFEESPPLSTYVIAFMLSELEVVKFVDDQKSLPMNIYVRKQFSKQVDFAHRVSLQALTFFATYFDFQYPSKKLDIGIIPNFPMAGMENFGFYHVSETPILLDEATASIYNMYDAASIICTEVANQWLGDMVTAMWWDDLWLIMAFGDYFAIIGIDNIFTDWKAADLGFLRKFQNTIQEDGLITSHPIVVPINYPKEIDTLYDTITYEKSPLLIRMTNLLLGEENFKKSIATFVNKYHFATATRDDLWLIMTDIAHANNLIPKDLTIKAFMDSWLLQAGYPCILVKINYQDKKVFVSQERFLSKPNTALGSTSPDKPCWIVPLSFTTSLELEFKTTAKQWLFCPDTADPSKPLEIQLDNITENDWIIFNIRMEAPIQILYEETNCKAIQKTLSQENQIEKIEVLSRVQMILDAFSFAWQGKLTYKIAFDFVQYVKFEKLYLPWRVTLRSFADIRYLLLRTQTFEPFQKFVRTLLEPKFKEFGSITELSRTVYIETHFKTFVTFWACAYAIDDCRKQSVVVFENWMKSPDPDKTNPVPADIQETVYCQGAQVNDAKYWNFLYERYKKSTEPTELSKISAALACSLDVQTLETLLDWSLLEANIRREESAWVFSSVCDNDIAFDIVKKFLTARFNDIYDYHKGDPNTLTTYLTAFATLIIKDEELTEFQTFWDSQKSKLEKVNRENIIEKATDNIGWRKLHYDEISKLFPS